ncbi:alpha/beta fold hydrolase [Saccharopolyspora sp. NPDC002376]
MTRRFARRAGLLAAVLLLTACADGADDAAHSPEAEVVSPTTSSFSEHCNPLTASDLAPPDRPLPTPVQAPQSAHRDLAYASTSAAQKLDLYLPAHADPKGAPLIVLIHGGGFIQGDKSHPVNLHVVSSQLARGYAVASINYRLSCEAAFPAGAQDVKAAIRWLRVHAPEYDIDPGRFIAWGPSSGAYMATLVAVTGDQRTQFDDDSLGNPGASSAVQGAVAWYGPYDFGKMAAQFDADTPKACKGKVLKHDVANSPESIWFRGPLQSELEKSYEADPATYLPTAGKIPPINFAAGDSDCVVPHEQTQDMYRAVKAAGGRTTLAVVPHAGHDLRVAVAQLEPALAFAESITKS